MQPTPYTVSVNYLSFQEELFTAKTMKKEAMPNLHICKFLDIEVKSLQWNILIMGLIFLGTLIMLYPKVTALPFTLLLPYKDIFTVHPYCNYINQYDGTFLHLSPSG